jgi:hypothetical protein
VDSREHEIPPGPRELDPGRQGGPGFLTGRQNVIRPFQDRKAAEESHPILATLVRHEFSEDVIHAGEGSILGGLIQEPCPLHQPIDLLKGHEVRGDLVDEASDPLQIKNPIGSLAVVGVVDEEPKGVGSGW